MNLKNTTLAFAIIASVLSCKKSTETATAETKNTEKKEQVTSVKENTLVGDYVSAEYAKRNEGYDWVAVSVSQVSDSTLHVSVRSRADKKKPTCTFDADATKVSENVYSANKEGKDILFTFKDNSITISTEKQEDSGILNYYCSGGGSLADTYKKINEPLDEKQIDPRIFTKTLSLQNITFDVSATGKGSTQKLVIQPFGLKTSNEKITLDIDGKVTNAEIEDLNSDGFPEVLVYTTSAGSGSYGNVIGYSVNNGKSMSQIAFPNIADNPKANKGYMGHDEFAIVETTLVQRFKIYNDGDTNAKPTGKTRQIQYKLKDGEASRKFVVDKILEY
ncbi:MAG: PliI family lysozyme inhibitor of I-type lysozyme [Cloacibacterium sp.]|nr:PliI family lysozyme inhibitor of I-type lysozyme [Cloacibacterium sp.]